MRLLALLLMGAALPAQALPRVASLDLCADRLLLTLADPSQIAALTVLAADPSLAEPEGARYPHTRGSAEEVIAHVPDVALTMGYGNERGAGLLMRFHMPVRRFEAPARIGDVPALFEAVGEAIGRAAEGHAQADAFRARWEALARAAPAAPPRVLMLYHGGYAEPPGGLYDDAIRRMGARNYLEGGVIYHGAESLLLDPPDLLVLFEDADAPPTAALDPLRLPAVQRMMQHRIVRVSQREAICPTPAMLPALARIRKALS